MRSSQLARNMLKYLPVLAVVGATVIGALVGKGLYPTALDSEPKTPTQSLTEPNNPQPLPILGGWGPCGLYIYTSLPPKCRTLDGKFIPLPGTSLYDFVTPEGR